MRRVGELDRVRDDGAGRKARARRLQGRGRGGEALVLAGGVALSRVYTGVHYPGDVLAGAALGAGLAAVTLRWWPWRLVEAAVTLGWWPWRLVEAAVTLGWWPWRPVEAAFAPSPLVRGPVLPDGVRLVCGEKGGVGVRGRSNGSSAPQGPGVLRGPEGAVVRTV